MGEKTELSDHEINLAVTCDGAGYLSAQDVRFMNDIKKWDDILQMENNHRKSNLSRAESDSTLWRTNGERFKPNNILKCSLSATFDPNKRVADVASVELQTHQSLVSENRFSYDNEIPRGTLSHHSSSISLPATQVFSNLILNRGDVRSENDISEILATTRINKGEIFNRRNKKDASLSDVRFAKKEGVVDARKRASLTDECVANECEEVSKKKSASETEEIGEEMLEQQSNSEEMSNDKIRGKSNSTNTNSIPLNTCVRDNSASRPSLIDDNKLVKMSLLTNPINIMQSNVQLLNKSRNFLNFLTEKSTNIMEKALLPQHMAMRYNQASKSVNAIETAGTLQANNESSSADATLKIDVDSAKRSNGSEAYSVATKENAVSDDRKENEMWRFDNNNRKSRSMLIEGKYSILDSDDGCTSDEEGTNERIEHYSSLSNQNRDRSNVDDGKSSGVCTSEDSSTEKSEYSSRFTLSEDYDGLRSEHLRLLDKLERLEKSSCSYTDTAQVESLEKTVNKLTAELNTSLAAQETLRRECIAANKERESMVMKYATSEKQLIDSQSAKDGTERKIKELTKEQDSLQNKLRQAQGERTRICSILDSKCCELTDVQKEVEKLKDALKLKEIKLLWTQNKLQTEVTSQRETQQKLDKALTKISNMKEECDHIRRETQESFRKFQQSEENKAVTLDQQLKEHQARLILERHVTEDKEILRLQLQKEMEVLKSKQKDLMDENQWYRMKLDQCEKARLNDKNSLSDLKTQTDQYEEEISKLSSKVSDYDKLKLQLRYKEEYIITSDAQMQQLQSANKELRSDIQACRQKEADTLAFMQKLTDKNVCLQSELTAIQTRANFLESEHGPLRERINELTSKVKILEEELVQEQKQRREECEILAMHVAEQTQLAQSLAQKLEDTQGENEVLKRKYQASSQELKRELQQCRKKREMFETASSVDASDLASRNASSISATIDETSNGALPNNNANGIQIHSFEHNKQLLMDRIIKLQDINVKRAEKLDFLKEHTQSLMMELQKKEKIIQNYILQQNFGALGCNKRDKHKADLAKHGGIMASVYNHRVSDENMTLELSLEINQKLEAVLEDALLKNITLKGNIDTLGKEIARLTMQHQRRQSEDK